ncbi:hypothetical protein L5515_004608 [Caenorhabditis briggsae]|uniref:Uncharacterized protein n=1 Tax=Caenorhabditis briggsae TaxID=6238 RepID=A0AAE9JD87_CAEBR|nr:hypothetical protein L5515_004608 [Caenorhabditis briggsae]
MARVTIDEIKKMLETEKELTSVMDKTSRMLKRSSEALEKYMTISGKQMEVMEKHTEALERNTETMEKYIEIMENQLTKDRHRKRSERIRLPSTSSEIMEISIPPLPTPATPEPTVKKAKVEVQVDNSTSSTQYKAISRWSAPTQMEQIAIATPSLLNITPNVQSSSGSHQMASQFSNPFRQRMTGCIYCSDNNYGHTSEMCPILKDSLARVNFMRLNRLCFTCAEPIFRCPGNYQCRFGNRKCHHCPGTHLNALCVVKKTISTAKNDAYSSAMFKKSI